MLFRGGLHILEIGKRLLVNNFIDNLSNFFTNNQDAPTLHLNFKDQSELLTPTRETSEVSINAVVKVSNN